LEATEEDAGGEEGERGRGGMRCRGKHGSDVHKCEKMCTVAPIFGLVIEYWLHVYIKNIGIG